MDCCPQSVPAYVSHTGFKLTKQPRMAFNFSSPTSPSPVLGLQVCPTKPYLCSIGNPFQERHIRVCVCVCIRRTDQRQRTVFNQWYPISPSPKSKLNRHWLLLWPSVSLAEKAWKLEAWLGLVWMGDETWDSCMGFHIQQSAGFVLLRQALY